MSTKNLARTVIEGGRHRYSKWYRRHSWRAHRAAESAALAEARRSPDLDALMFVPRASAYKAFDDKLGPAKRWLSRQLGRPWDKVRGELVASFDTRTVPGRHIVYDHMFPWVSESRLVHDGRALGSPHRVLFVVDAHGILRRARDVVGSKK